jgi:hypothetical protein
VTIGLEPQLVARLKDSGKVHVPLSAGVLSQLLTLRTESPDGLELVLLLRADWDSKATPLSPEKITVSLALDRSGLETATLGVRLSTRLLESSRDALFTHLFALELQPARAE